MSAHMLSQAAHLSDQDLITRVKLLAQREREATAVLIAHLVVLDERRLYLAEGCSSLFTYCTQVLQLSEHAAYGRIEAARAARKYPLILERLADGSVNLTTVGLLAPHLMTENHRSLLDEARHKTKRQVEDLVVRLRPLPAVPSTIRRLPMPKNGSVAVQAAADESDVGSVSLALSAAPPPSQSSVPAPLPLSRRAIIEALAPQQYRVQFTADDETCEKLRLAQALLRHQIPDGDLGKVIDQALTALLKGLGKQKHAATDRPREAARPGKATHPRDPGRPDEGASGGKEKSRRKAPRSRHIPAEVKRAVWARDGGQCSFVAHDGRRCTEQGFLEFHHAMPYATGGEATVDNIQLRCRAHNGYEAELFFGGNGRLVREAPSAYRTLPSGSRAQLGPSWTWGASGS